MPKKNKPIVWQQLAHDIDNAVLLIKVEEYGVWRSSRRKKKRKTSTILHRKLQQEEEDDKPAIGYKQTWGGHTAPPPQDQSQE